MANLLLFPPQEFKLKDLEDQFPTSGYKNRKYVFQCEVREIKNSNDVVFGVIGYPAWRKGNSPRQSWIIGTKVRGKTIRPADPGNPDETVYFDPNNPQTFVALGNNEVFLGPATLKNSKKYEKEVSEKANGNDQTEFAKLYKAILKDEKKLEKASLSFKSKIWQNPHVYYDVTLTDGSSSSTYATNPCPPNQPGE
jgi:hypothetical protein